MSGTLMRKLEESPAADARRKPLVPDRFCTSNITSSRLPVRMMSLCACVFNSVYFT